MSLPLQQAQGQWAKDQNDNEWVIVNNSGSEISRLPACLKDFEAMRVIHFGREFERLAFAKGKEVGAHEERVKASKDVQSLRQENYRLHNEIDNLMLQNSLITSEGAA